MFQDAIKATGRVSFKLHDKDGNLKEEVNVDNLVVTTGKNFIAQRMTGTPTVMGYMAVGTDGTAAAVGNTALGGELARVAITSGTSALNVSTYVATFGAGVGTGALQEAGIFDANVVGNMLCRTTYAVINKGASDTLTITWQITIG